MRRASLVFIAVSAFLASIQLAASRVPGGDLQVTCRPGYRLYLDGAFVGLTITEEDGRYLRGVASGRHVLRVEKLGFEPRELEVDVPSGGVVEVKVGELSPERGAPAPTATPSPASGPPPPVSEGAPSETHPPAIAQEAPGDSPPAADVRSASGGAVAAHPVGPTAEGPASAAPVSVSPIAVAPPAPPAAGFDLGRGVAFVYRATGAALSGTDASRRSVSIYRERGGPRAPALVFLCSGEARCEERTAKPLEPGSYLFRVTFRSWGGGSGKEGRSFDKDMRVEIEAKAGHAYVIGVTYDATAADACHVEVDEIL